MACLEQVSLGEAAQEAWANVETGRAELDVEEDVLLQADEGRLTQLLENLHRDAAQHAGEAPTVRVDPLAEGFYVEDDGEGIPDAQRDRVLETGFSTSEEGTGFGPTIVRRIAKTHGWEITIDESRQGGARFEFVAEAEP